MSESPDKLTSNGLDMVAVTVTVVLLHVAKAVVASGLHVGVPADGLLAWEGW